MVRGVYVLGIVYLYVFFFFSRGLEVVEGNFDFKVSESRLVISLFGGRISFKGLGLFIFVGNFNDSVKFRRIM